MRISIRYNQYQSFLTVIAALGLISIAFLSQRYLRVQLRDLDFNWLLELRRGSFTIMSMALLAPMVYWLKVRVPFTQQAWIRPLGVHLIASLVFALIHLWFITVIGSNNDFWHLSKKVFLNFFHLEVLGYWLILGISTLVPMKNRPTTPLPKTLDNLQIKDRGLVMSIAIAEIIKIQAQDHYLKIHIEGRRHLCRQPIKRMEKQLLPSGFVRVHRSWLVNRNFVQGVSARNVHMVDGSLVPVGRKYAAKARQMVDN